MIMFIYQSEGYDGTNYLDDLAGAEVQQLACQAYQILSDILVEAGAEEAISKAITPSTCMLFLGILIDTILMRLQIDPQRMQEIRNELRKWLGVETTSLKQLQSLVGKLNFCATVVRAGRLFFSRILNFMRGMPSTGKVVIPQEVKQDIRWWVLFMPQFNGISAIPEPKWIGPNALFATDACPQGARGWSQGEFFHTSFPCSILNDERISINELEALTVMVGLKLWGHKTAGKKFLVQCDNNNTVLAINSGRSRNVVMQHILREICYWTALNDSQIRAIFIPGKDNRICDCLSRWEISPVFRQKFYKYTAGLITKQVTAHKTLFFFSNKW